MYERLKGYRDFYADEMVARRTVFDTIEDTARRFGFREIGTPSLERTQMYVDKSGEEIVEQLYSFTDAGGRDISLVPELTPTVARMVVERHQAIPKPIKWFSTRPFWRYEQVQQGRFREFYQTNIDIFGSANPDADAEVLACAADILTGLGLTGEDFEFRVSHRDILSGLLKSFGSDIEVAAAIRAVDKRNKISEDEYFDLLEAAGLTLSEATEFDELLDVDQNEFDDLISFAGTSTIETAVKNLQGTLDVVANLGAREYCTVSLRTARGLDYYTGVVFECFDSMGEVSRSIFGGGRYDELIEDFGGPDTPAVGFAIGDATLTELLQRVDGWPTDALSTDYYVLQIGDTRQEAARITCDLRARGNTVETDLMGRSFTGQLDYADSINAETVVVVGEQDLEAGLVTLKDMATGDQAQAPITDFPGELDRPTYHDFA